jgi:hypothetical protein
MRTVRHGCDHGRADLLAHAHAQGAPSWGRMGRRTCTFARPPLPLVGTP